MNEYVEVTLWSLFFVTWISYGMHVLKEFVVVRLRDGE